MKYRVKQIGNRYYPQYKFLCFWFNFGEYVYGDSYIRVSRFSLLEAKQFIDLEINRRAEIRIEAIHPYP